MVGLAIGRPECSWGNTVHRLRAPVYQPVDELEQAPIGLIGLLGAEQVGNLERAGVIKVDRRNLRGVIRLLIDSLRADIGLTHIAPANPRAEVAIRKRDVGIQNLLERQIVGEQGFAVLPVAWGWMHDLDMGRLAAVAHHRNRTARMPDL